MQTKEIRVIIRLLKPDDPMKRRTFNFKDGSSLKILENGSYIVLEAGRPDWFRWGRRPNQLSTTNPRRRPGQPWCLNRSRRTRSKFDFDMENLAKFETDLWEAADNLRANSKLTSSDYFMPVLGIIFMRHPGRTPGRAESL